MRRRRGFTLIEILIAVAILGLGVAGIVALFPSTIQTASSAVQDTYAASIANSVVASLAAARRDHMIFRALPGAKPTKYLIFDHDGVLDQRVLPLPGMAAGRPKGSQYYQINNTLDYIVLLPRFNSPNKQVPAAFPDPSPEPVLLFPAPPGSNRSWAAITANIPDEAVFKPSFDGSQQLWVQKVFPLGRYGNPPPVGYAVGDVRAEFLAPAATAANRYPIDNYPQYSFAFTLRRVPLVAPFYSSELYEVHVLVYRNFDAVAAAAVAGGTPIPRSNVPILELVSQIDVGPKGTFAGGSPSINGKPLNLKPGTVGTNPCPQQPGGDAFEADPGEEY